MKALTANDIFQLACKGEGKWGLYIHITTPEPWYEYMPEMTEACTFLDLKEHTQILMDRVGYFLFDTQEACHEAFGLCVGDDGPTPGNPYNGKVRVYALTCSPQGQLMNENT